MPEDLESLRLQALRLKAQAMRRELQPSVPEQIGTGLRDIYRFGATAAGRAISGVAGIPGAVQQGADVLAGLATGKPAESFAQRRAERSIIPSPPPPEAIEQAYGRGMTELGQAAGIDLSPYEPTSTAGKIGMGALSAAMAPMALSRTPAGAASLFNQTQGLRLRDVISAGAGYNPQNAVKAFAPFTGALSGAGAEAAGIATEGTPLEPFARAAGGIAGGLVGGGTGILAQRQARTPLGSAMAGATDEQLAAAGRLVAEAQAQGRPITTFEAMAQVQGGNPNLMAVQRMVEQTDTGNPALRQMMAGRAGANEAAFERNVLPPMGAPAANPDLLPSQMQGAARSALARQRGQVSQAFKGAYETAGADTVPEDAVRGVLTTINNEMLKDKAGILKPMMRDIVKKMLDKDNQPITDVSVLADVRRYIRDMYDPKEALKAIPSKQRHFSQTISKQIDDVLREHAPDMKTADVGFAQAQREFVEPLSLGTTGRVARTSTMQGQAAQLLPKAPDVQTPETAVRAVRAIKGTPGGSLTARQWVRTYIQSQFDEAARDLQSGPPAQGAANFAAKMAGNRNAEKILYAVVEETGGKTAAKGLENFTEISRAQGQRLPPGSPTTWNQQLREAYGFGLKKLGSPLQYAAELADRQLFWEHANQIMEAVTQPEGLKTLQKLALLNPRSAKARLAAAELLAITRPSTDEQP